MLQTYGDNDSWWDYIAARGCNDYAPVRNYYFQSGAVHQGTGYATGRHISDLFSDWIITVATKNTPYNDYIKTAIKGMLGYEYADVDDARDYFYLHVRGDSMKDCGMVDGSLVLFRKQQYANEGDIVACLVGGECATVKRFSRNRKTVFLLPENEDYSPIKLTTDDFEAGDARILGIAVEIKIKL